MASRTLHATPSAARPTSHHPLSFLATTCLHGLARWCDARSFCMSMWQPVRGPFPATRMRRLRRYAWSRSMVEEHRLDVANLIWPVFLIEGARQREPIGAMPGVERITID
ncbi:MAG: hypothetical protein ACOVNV_06675, partial [Pirellulaceae bacterium]